MAIPKEPRLVKWRGYWYIFHYDWLSGEPIREPCTKYKARTKQERQRLLARFKDQALRDHVQSSHLVGGSDFKLKLKTAVGRFEKHLERQIEVRERNPDVRVGLSRRAATNTLTSINLFNKWLYLENLEQMTCDQLDSNSLHRFLDWLAVTPFRSGNATKLRSGTTLNAHREKLGTALRWLDSQRPKLFPDAAIFFQALKDVPVAQKKALAFTSKELGKFLKEAQKPIAPAKVSRKKSFGKREHFKQPSSRFPSTPVDRLFLLLALTGMRRAEALNLKWEDMDLKTGRIVVNARKTVNWRIIQLKDAPECSIAPEFLKTLRKWKRESEENLFVLPHHGIEQPTFPKHAWERIRRNSGIDITPQKLRQNFVSYCASMGVPPAVAAMWCGHSAQVAERNYRQQLLERNRSKSIQGAMGL